jgi:metal-responsive CopG/Arc/MetJ family transcriptional regulator
MKRRNSKRGAYRRAECEFIGAWIPSELMALLDEFVRDEDLDRSKMLRRAIEEKIRAARKARSEAVSA